MAATSGCAQPVCRVAIIIKSTIWEKSMRHLMLPFVAGTMLSVSYLPLALGQTTSTAGSDAGFELEEITITAQRRVEDIQKTAIPITAISGAEIAAKGQTQLDEVLRDAPSVQIQSAPQGADIVIRGVGGNDTGGISQDPTVSVFADGVYSGLAATNLGSLYDVKRVEVLRGPQGTLYGRNSSGGAVNILTNDPESEFGAGVNVGAGNLKQRRADAYINLPVIDSLALRLAVDRERRDGYYSNGAGEVDNTGVRLKGKWSPSDAFSLLARVDYWRQRGFTQTTVPVQGLDPTASCGGPPCELFAAANPGDLWDVGVASFSPFQVDPVESDNKVYTYSLQLDADLGFGTLTLLPSYTHSTQVQSSAGLFSPASPTHIYPTSTTVNKQYTTELRLSQPSSSDLKWVAGLYWLNNDANQYGTNAGGPAATWYAVQSSNKRPATSYAAFAQTTIPLTDTFRATLGGRYTVDEKKILYGVCSSMDGVNCGGNSRTGDLNDTYVSPATNLKNRYTSFTYKAGIEYDLAATAMGYAQVSTGYKAGGYSTATFPPVAYLPEKLTNYEVGIKSRWLDNRLELNADVYIYQYKDQQLELHPATEWTGIIPLAYMPDDYLPGGASAGTNAPILDVNAGNSRYKGVELQSKYQLTAHDQVRVEAAYNRAVYGHFVIDTVGGPPGTAYAAQYFDLTGKQEAHAPLWSGNVGYQHVWDMVGGELTLQGNMRLQSETGTTIQQWFADGKTVQPGYHQSDANLRYAAANDQWSVGLWVKNIENNAIVTYVYPLYKQTLDISRTYGATASYKF